METGTEAGTGMETGIGVIVILIVRATGGVLAASASAGSGTAHNRLGKILLGTG